MSQGINWSGGPGDDTIWGVTEGGGPELKLYGNSGDDKIYGNHKNMVR